MTTTANLPVAVQAKPVEVANVQVLRADNVGSASIGARAWEYEDEFAGRYGPLGSSNALEIMEPPFLPRTLEALYQQNNTLSVCINAILTNVHGTGHEIVYKDEEKKLSKTDKTKKKIDAFFEESFPGESFRKLRKNIGRDIERVGYAYVEMIRNFAGELMFMRRVDPKMMRMVKKDAAVPVTLKINRDGVEVSAVVMMRYRRFVQSLGGANLKYFKEFRCPRMLSARTGMWVDKVDDPLDAAGEILYFGKEDDSLTSYSTPAWIPQMPSVLGSRKAEEHNLDFFDAGGVPPILVLVEGGALTPEAEMTLKMHLNGRGRNRHTIPIITTLATGGTHDKPSNVTVKIERFGSEKQKDSMFENYDDKCEKRVRRSWRLPPLFVGAAEDFSFATAFASYTVAEAQVFAPERADFDEVMNTKVMPELDPSGEYKFRSKPLTVGDIEKQLRALEMAVEGQAIGREQLLKILNEITNLSMQLDDDDLAGQQMGTDPFAGLDPSMLEEYGAEGAGGGGAGVKPSASIGRRQSSEVRRPVGAAKSDDPAVLASATFKMFESGANGEAFIGLVRSLSSLSRTDLATFRQALTTIAEEKALTPGGRTAYAQLVTKTIMSLTDEKTQAAAA